MSENILTFNNNNKQDSFKVNNKTEFKMDIR